MFKVLILAARHTVAGRATGCDRGCPELAGQLLVENPNHGPKSRVQAKTTVRRVPPNGIREQTKADLKATRGHRWHGTRAIGKGRDLSWVDMPMVETQVSRPSSHCE